ncbi:hypothetical protein THAOC_12533 [Thalassiosira oceanica]|uniref:Uncharacterized protein n=1 Tax=Thalassiosira oceanica TaxID=159749 RepID=K0SNK0_THAOC|nr:hypothetical protein THAOC_12533 [Thalassiosira oceanica]|eukprot:EJK66544.1 hypothetical protein THAOC_12533 [Thalassiosira oceanica]
MKESPKGEAEKRSCMRTSSAFRTQSYFPPWARSPGGIELRLSTPSARPAQRRNNDDRESRAPPWPPLGYSDGSTAAVIYQTSRCNNGKLLCIIARAWPAEVSEPLITSLLWKPAATEVICGIELSLCSAACPSGTIYTSFWPDICAGLLGGSSAAPLSVGLPFEFGFADQKTPLPG